MSTDTLADLATMTVDEVADRIGIPVSNWPGNCYGIAVALVESGLLPSGSRAVYGHWHGPIAATSLFAGRRGVGFTGHGWVITDEDRIVDPTRWVFTDTDPVVYIGPDPQDSCEVVCGHCEHLDSEHGSFACDGGHMAGYDCGCLFFEPDVDPALAEDADWYDEGGNQLRAQMQRPLPTDGDPLTATPPATVLAVLTAHGHPGGPVTHTQAHWLANLPLPVLGGAAHATYTWLIDIGLSALIPWDNRVAVLGGNPTAA